MNKIYLLKIAVIITVIAFAFTACGSKKSGKNLGPVGIPETSENTETSETGNPENPGSGESGPGPDIIPEVPVYNVHFDTGEYSYSMFEHQTIAEGEKAVKPGENPVKTIPGLYVGNTGSSTFLHWVNKADNSEWIFSEYIVTENINLEAVWDDPERIDIGKLPGDNVIEKAIAFVKGNPGRYTLYIDENLAIKPQSVKAHGFNLTLRGIHQERIISLAGGQNGALFELGKWTSSADNTIIMEFTIGDNITLMGKNKNTEALVTIGDMAVTFTMLPGSIITGNEITSDVKAPAVEMQGKGSFTMKGGEITGNTNSIELHDENLKTVYKPSSAVLVPVKSNFKMESGNISGNTGGVGELVYIVSAASGEDNSYNNAIILGDSLVGTIAIVEEGNNLKRPLNISYWNPTGPVVLNLAGNTANSNVRKWFNDNRFVILPDEDVSFIMNNIRLGEFFNSVNQYSYSISDSPPPDSFKLDNATGKLVAK